MLAEGPDPKEVSDFHFRQLKTIKITKENENIPLKSSNLLASASKYGLLFVGMEGGFKVMKLEDILTLDEKESQGIETNYPFTFVSSGTPVILALNASQTVLAVCVRNASCISISLYSLSSFSGSGELWQPVFSAALSPPGVELQDFAWNPALEGLYAFCLSDGGLHIHETNGTSVKPAAILLTADAISVCWSPKGKQLVAGKRNGFFSQYKQTLQEVKTVAPPQLESPISVNSICWISTTIFGVVYVSGGSPNLFIVSTPKDSPVVYTNFYDICFGNNSAAYQKYLLHLEPSWGIMMCASLDSIEIAVLGDMPNWVQWDIKEDGKALLPGKDGATNPIGMTVMYSAQKQIIISESEIYGPMPILLLLTNNGLLVSFHMINAKTEAATLVSPPLPVELKSSISDAPVSNTPQITPKQAKQILVPSTNIAEKFPTAIQIPVSQSSEPQKIAAPANEPIKNSTFCFSDGPKENINVFGNETFVSNLNKPGTVTFNAAQETQERSFMNLGGQPPATEKQNNVQSSTDNSYMMAIISEIQNFVKEVQDLKQLQNFGTVINGEEDMASLKIFALNLHNFQKDISETMQSISSDVYNLKKVLLESFVMLQEAESREIRKNDHSYITMLKERALDPITAKRMQKINQHYQYLNLQLQEVSDRLDQDWIHLMSDKKKSLRSHLCMSSTQAVYQTIVNNQKTIHNLRKDVNRLQKKYEERKLRNTTKSNTWSKHHNRMAGEDLSKLADDFLAVKVSEEVEEPAVTKKLSAESQSFLKTFLKDSSVLTVRPTAVYSPSQSRLLSNAVPSNFSKYYQDKDILSKQVSAAQKPENEISACKTVTLDKCLDEASSEKDSANKSTPQPYAPVYEPITPPSVTSPRQSISKTATAFNVSGISVIGDKNTELRNVDHSTTTFGALPVLQKDADGEFISTIPSYGENNKEVVQTLSFSSGDKLPSSATTSSIFPSTPSFRAGFQKSQESAEICNTASLVMQSFEKKDTSSLPSVTVSPLSQASKTSFSLEASQTTHQEIPQAPPSIAVLSMPSLQSPSLTTPKTTSSQISPSPSFVVPMKKNSVHVPVPKPLFDIPQTSSFFGKPSTNIEQSNLLKKDGIPPDVKVSSALEFNKNTSDSKLVVNKPELSTDGQKPVVRKSNDFFNSSTLKASDSTPATDTLTTTSNQFSFSNFSDLKQLVAPTSLLASESPVVSSSPVGIIATEPVSTQNLTTVTSAPTVATVVSPQDVTTSKSSSSPTSSETVTASTVSFFGQSVTICSPTSSDTVKTTEPSATTSSIGPKSLFGKSASETPFFQAATTTTTASSPPAFGQTSTTQTTSAGQSSNFSSAAGGGFFTQAPGFGTPTTNVTSVTNSDLSNQTSTFSFGKAPLFGQTTSSFGLTKSFFGQNTTPASETNTASSFSFNQSSNTAFGQGSFFSGLGGKPSEENANKNVFSISSGVKTGDSNNLFRNSNVTSFDSVSNSTSAGGGGGNSFSGSGSFSTGGGSVAQSGFGAFQQQSSTQQSNASTGAFGAALAFGVAPAFGSSPTFGGAPAFGSSPSFATGNALSSVFAQQQVSSNFSNFANASSPTFGSLASQSPVFNAPSSGSGFGSQASPPAFGMSSSFTNQSPGFGSPGSPPSNSSAFTQWRN